MSRLDTALNEYLAIRRALGFELREVAGCCTTLSPFSKPKASHITVLKLAGRIARALETSAWPRFTPSFSMHVAFDEPAHALLCQRILAMPTKRHERRPIEFLNRQEIDALLAVTDSASWIGRRDRTMLWLTVQMGLRVSELIGLSCQDIVLEPAPISIAKGRAENIGAHLSGQKRQRCWMPARTPRSS
jgi:integrase